MRQPLFVLLALLLAAAPLSAQKAPTYTEKSDPEAKKLLDGLRARYDKYTTMQVDFTLNIEAGEDQETQKGQMSLAGEKYHVSVAGQQVWCDGSSVWLYQERSKEVQITDADDEEADILSPSKMMRLYEDEASFICAIVGEQYENGRLMQYIELKPRDRYAEYSKIRMAIDKKAGELKYMKVFGKSGDRYTLTLDKVVGNKAFAESFFVFPKAQYPGAKVTDLRL